MKKENKNNELKIELITCESGDYEVLKIDDEIYHAGHSIPNDIWLEVFKLSGNKIVKTSISGEEMEQY